VLLITVLAVVLVGGGLSAWLLSAPSYDRATARGTAEAFADALNSSNVDAAKELLCSTDRRGFGQSTAGALGSVNVTLDRVDADSDKGTAVFTMSANVAGASIGSQDVTIPLQRTGDDGQWEICGLSDAGFGN
jgi:hypothetical protein